MGWDKRGEEAVIWISKLIIPFWAGPAKTHLEKGEHRAITIQGVWSFVNVSKYISVKPVKFSEISLVFFSRICRLYPRLNNERHLQLDRTLQKMYQMYGKNFDKSLFFAERNMFSLTEKSCYSALDRFLDKQCDNSSNFFPSVNKLQWTIS